MKQIKTILACGLVLASVGFASMLVAAEATRDGKAIVRSIHGDVTYQAEGGEFKKLRTNMELGPKTLLQSGADGVAYLQVNGYTSTVKLTENTKVTLAEMEQMGGMVGGDSKTNLKLDKGTVLGSVRKLSANSTYEVAVPNGVAGIRGTDFSVTVTVNANGSFTVDFRSVTGQLLCSVTPIGGGPGPNQQNNLTTGQTWTVTGTINQQGGAITATVGIPGNTPPAVQAAIVSAVQQTVTVIANAIAVASTGHGAGTTTTTTTPTQSSTSPSETGTTVTVTAQD
jgi:hypothetical protein